MTKEEQDKFLPWESLQCSGGRQRIKGYVKDQPEKRIPGSVSETRKISWKSSMGISRKQS
jgi:hypothetical protein